MENETSANYEFSDSEITAEGLAMLEVVRAIPSEEKQRLLAKLKSDKSVVSEAAESEQIGSKRVLLFDGAFEHWGKKGDCPA